MRVIQSLFLAKMYMNPGQRFLGSSTRCRRNWNRTFNSTIRLTVHTNPSQKRDVRTPHDDATSDTPRWRGPDTSRWRRTPHDDVRTPYDDIRTCHRHHLSPWSTWNTLTSGHHPLQVTTLIPPKLGGEVRWWRHHFSNFYWRPRPSWSRGEAVITSNLYYYFGLF